MHAGPRLSPVDIKPDNPLRPVDWRWHLAGFLADGAISRDLIRRHDPWLERAVRFGATHGADGELAADLDDPISGALRLHRGDPVAKLEVEARLLAGQSIAEVADRCGLDPETVEAYEALFFDVADHLGRESYILHQAIGPRLQDPAPEDLDVIVKALAYVGGPFVLDAVLDALGLRSTAAVAPGLALGVRMTIASMCLPVTPRTAPEIIRLHLLVEEVLGREAGRAATPTMGPVRVSVTTDEELDLMIAAIERDRGSSPGHEAREACVEVPARPRANSAGTDASPDPAEAEWSTVGPAGRETA
jgi:hypothetical protein